MPIITSSLTTTVRRIYRLISLLLHMFIGILLTFIFASIMNVQYNERSYSAVINWWLSRITTIMGIQVRFGGKAQQLNVLYVANHVSWIDIPVLGRVLGTQFIAKKELRRAPAIGWLAEHAGTLFLLRGQSGAAYNLVKQIANRLQNKQSLLFFPEGTRGHGRRMRRFFPRLFSCAISTKTPIQPVAINYNISDARCGTAISRGDRQGAAVNLWGLLGVPSIEVQVHLLPLVNPVGMTRNQLASTCERLIREKVE